MGSLITIKSSKEIKNILSKGKKFATDNLIFFYKKSNLGFPRFAFVISKKFSKKAVERNRAKRIIKEALRLNFEDLNYDIVIIPKKHLTEKKMQDIIKDIQKFQNFLRELDEKSVSTDN